MDVTVRTIDQAMNVGGHVYHRHRLTFRGREGFGMRLNARSIGHVVIGTLQYRGPVRIDAAEFVDSYQVNVPLYGGVLMSYGGREYPATVRQAVVHGPSAPTWIEGWRVPTRLLGVKILRPGLEGALARILGRVVERPVEFAGTLDVASPSGREWLLLARRLAWWTRGGSDDDVLVGPTLVDGVIDGLLRTSWHEHSLAVGEAAARRGEEATRRAMSLMHLRAGSPVTVPEIAAGAGIGPRALEKRLHAQWGHTPSQLLREIRLCYARRQLQESAGRVRVADVAARWGMPHAGRFSAHYAERFGETPSATVARSPASETSAPSGSAESGLAGSR